MERALTECGSDKAPSLDGLNLGLINAGWSFSKSCLLTCFQNFTKRVDLIK